jgi:hypothetical protein
MAVEERKSVYEVIVWDYDDAPDGDGYYISSRGSFEGREKAAHFARCAGDRAVSAEVFLDQVSIACFGDIIFGYPPKS